MPLHTEDELVDALTILVALWKSAQHSDGKTRPLIGSLNSADLSAPMYLVKGMASTPARLPARPISFQLSVIEALIMLGYLRPTDGPGVVTYLHPTTDALFLADLTTRGAYRVVFHRRYERLHRTLT